MKSRTVARIPNGSKKKVKTTKPVKKVVKDEVCAGTSSLASVCAMKPASVVYEVTAYNDWLVAAAKFITMDLNKQVGLIPQNSAVEVNTGTVFMYLLQCFNWYCLKAGIYGDPDNNIPDMDDAPIPGWLGVIFQNLAPFEHKQTGAFYRPVYNTSTSNLTSTKVSPALSVQAYGNTLGTLVVTNAGAVELNFSDGTGSLVTWPLNFTARHAVGEAMGSIYSTVAVSKLSHRAANGDFILRQTTPTSAEGLFGSIGPACALYCRAAAIQVFGERVVLPPSNTQQLDIVLAIYSVISRFCWGPDKTLRSLMKEARFNPHAFSLTVTDVSPYPLQQFIADWLVLNFSTSAGGAFANIWYNYWVYLFSFMFSKGSVLSSCLTATYDSSSGCAYYSTKAAQSLAVFPAVAKSQPVTEFRVGNTIYAYRFQSGSVSVMQSFAGASGLAWNYSSLATSVCCPITSSSGVVYCNAALPSIPTSYNYIPVTSYQELAARVNLSTSGFIRYQYREEEPPCPCSVYVDFGNADKWTSNDSAATVYYMGLDSMQCAGWISRGDCVLNAVMSYDWNGRHGYFSRSFGDVNMSRGVSAANSVTVTDSVTGPSIGKQSNPAAGYARYMYEQLAPKTVEAVYSFTANQLVGLGKTAVRPYIRQVADASVDYLKEMLSKGMSMDRIMPYLIGSYMRYGPLALSTLKGGRARLAIKN